MTAENRPPYDPFAGADGVRPDEAGHIDAWDSLALDLLEGTLPPHVAAPLEAHLAGCPDCRRALAEQRSMAAWLRAVPEMTVPAALERAILEGSAGVLGPEPVGAAHKVAGRTWVGSGALESLRRLLDVRVWLPAAAVILVAGIALSSYYQPAMEDGNEAVTTLATEGTQKDAAAPPQGGAGDDGTLEAAPGSERDQTVAAGQATSTTMAGAAMMGVTSPVIVLTVGGPGDDPDTLAQQIKDLTGLEPLPRDSWVEGRTTYAALIATDEAAPLASGLGAAGSETLPSAEYAVSVPPALADLLGADALTTLPLLTPQTADAASAGRLWLPERDAAQRSGDEGDLTIVVITLGAAPLR